MCSETGELWRSLGKDPSLAALILHELAGRVKMQPSTPENSLPSEGEEGVEFADEEPLKVSEEGPGLTFWGSFGEKGRERRSGGVIRVSERR